MWYQKIEELTAQYFPDGDALRYLHETRCRVEYTIDALRSFNLKGKKVCEIGFGAIGLGIYLELRVDVDAYDVSSFFTRVCNDLGINHTIINLNTPQGVQLDDNYDLIVLCEVIEHLSRWPVSVLQNLYKYLQPGGTLLITTPNLLRLSNRIRLLTGKKLFSHFVPEALIMGHLREYTPEEMDFFLRRAGFTKIRIELQNFPDITRSRLKQTCCSIIAKLFPRLSNYIFCWSEKPYMTI